ncbi:MAG: hypothetical protein MJ252_30385, partial [archaeon]|nr:hypothetical protein [archaeon]
SFKIINISIMNILRIINSNNGESNFNYGKPYYLISNYFPAQVAYPIFEEAFNKNMFTGLHKSISSQINEEELIAEKNKENEKGKVSLEKCIGDFSKTVNSLLNEYFKLKDWDEKIEFIQKLSLETAKGLCDDILNEMNKLHVSMGFSKVEDKNKDTYNDYVKPMSTSLTFILLALECEGTNEKVGKQYLLDYYGDEDNQITKRNQLLSNILKFACFIYTGRDEWLEVENYLNLTILYQTLMKQKKLVLKSDLKNNSKLMEYNFKEEKKKEEKNKKKEAGSITYNYCEETKINKGRYMDPKNLCQKIIAFVANFEKKYSENEKKCINKRETLFTRFIENNKALEYRHYGFMFGSIEDISCPDKKTVKLPKYTDLLTTQKLYNYSFFKEYIFGDKFKEKENYAEFLLKAIGDMPIEDPNKSLMINYVLSPRHQFLKILKYSLQYEEFKKIFKNYIEEVKPKLLNDFKEYINLIQLSHNPEEEIKLAYNCVNYLQALHQMLENFKCDFLSDIYDFNLIEEEKKKKEEEEKKKEEEEENKKKA